MRRARVPLMLLLSMLAVIMQPATAGADSLTQLQARIAQAQQALKELAARRQGQQVQVEQLRSATDSSTAELRRIDQELLSTISKLNDAEASLQRVQQEQQALEGQIAEKQAQIEQRANVYATRLRALYKFTRTSPLEELLAARSFSDALQRITMMQAVARVDNYLLAQLRAEQQDLLKAHEALQQKRAEEQALRDEIERQRQVLVQRRAEQAAAVARAQAQQQQAEAQLSSWDQQARDLSAQITALQSQYQQELAEIERQRQLEEQRRREEAARAAAQATATAQAAAAAQATARARPGSSGSVSAAQGGALPPLPGQITTSGLGPSASGLIWPLTNPVVTTEFGERTFAQSFHTGIDLAQSLYTPVMAAGDGIVLESGLAVPGHPEQSYGMMVIIGHSQTLSTLYAHLDNRAHAPVVKAGQQVKRGQVIGYVGMTGLTTGPHLHFEVRVSGNPQNPRNFLPR